MNRQIKRQFIYCGGDLLPTGKTSRGFTMDFFSDEKPVWKLRKWYECDKCGEGMTEDFAQDKKMKCTKKTRNKQTTERKTK